MRVDDIMATTPDAPSSDCLTPLPTRAELVRQLVTSEQSEGWIAKCDDDGQYLLLCRELIVALAEQLRALPQPIVEIGSGSGDLARALSAFVHPVIATDVRPASDANDVVLLDARQALKQFEPRTVLTCFPPVDARFDEAVLQCSAVEQYLVLQTHQHFTQFLPLLRCGWLLQPLPTVSRTMVTRHDFWLPSQRDTVRHVGEAWLVTRART